MFIRMMFIVLMSLVVFGCTSNDNTYKKANQATNLAATAPARQQNDWLTDTHAKLRKRQVSDLSYQLDIDLSRTDYFSGEATLDFTNHLLSDDLTLDFSQGTVDNVWLNGKAIDYVYNDFFITIAKSELVLGKNQLKINYRHNYSDNGSGLYRYYDKTDNNTYLYTHFEPYEANKVFPGFDQPNMRASYTLNVIAPADWTVITSVTEKQVKSEGEFKHWHFPPSAKISSYVFPLHAGPYTVWHDRFEDIPLRLFARQSMAKYIDSTMWFDVSKKGLSFFNDYFDYQYPFGKYDQVLVPDFNISGMENVAAVTYSERVLSRGKMTEQMRDRVAGLILHEMSHMWFGDLTTIDWWSNLWLKESFATYMSNVALEKTGLSENVWGRFYTNTKQAAYRADDLVTTHAIQMPVDNSKSGVASFDMITYSKGASVLNQLTHYLGYEPFKASIRQYFKRYDYQAAKLPDFMDTLSEVSGRDLTQWTQDWLYRAGTNQIKVAFECENDKVSQFSVEQSASEAHPVLREHAINIGLYALGQKLTPITTQAITISGRLTKVNALIGAQCPDMVYPNHGDWGFVKVVLDNKTRQHIERAIPLIEDSMLRSMYYQSLWDMVSAQQMSITNYIDIVMGTMADEQNLKVLSLVMRHLYGAYNYLQLFEQQDYRQKNHYLTKLEQFAWQQLDKQTPSTDQQRGWFEMVIGSSISTTGLKKLAELLHGKQQITGLLFDQDLRWRVLTQLASHDYHEVASLLAIEKANDSSHQGDLSAIAVDATQPNIEAKLRWIAEFEKTTERLTAQKQKMAMRFLFPSHQAALFDEVAERLIGDLVSFDVDRDQKLISTMVRSVMPLQCTKASVARLQKAIANNPQLGLIASKGLKEAHQADQKCVALSQVN